MPGGLAALAFALYLSLSIPGCVSRGSHEQDMALLEKRLLAVQSELEDTLGRMDAKLQEKNKTLGTLTERYGALQKDYEALQKWRNTFIKDLESLARDVSELKIVVSSNLPNIKGPSGNTMLIHIIDMEDKVKELLKVEVPPLPPSTVPVAPEPAGQPLIPQAPPNPTNPPASRPRR